jgi:hypothetical protein
MSFLSGILSVLAITGACVALGKEHGALTGINVWTIAFTLLWNSWK